MQKLRLKGVHLAIADGTMVYAWRFHGQSGSLISIGSQSIVQTQLVLETNRASVKVGDRSFIGGRGVFSVAAAVEVGSDVMIAWGCTVTDHDSHSPNFAERKRDVTDYIQGRKSWERISIKPTKICDKAWIGFNSSILKGVTIGEGGIVAACSVVTKDVPAWTVVAGNPAREIRKLDPQ